MNLLTDLSAKLTQRRRDDLAGRRVIVIAPVLAGATDQVAQLHADGVDDILVLTWNDGTGPLPDESSVRVHRLPAYDVESVMDEIHCWQDLLAHPSDDVRRVVEEFDPDRRAAVLLHAAVGADEFCGRATYRSRPVRQVELEDKTLCREIWQGAGIPHAPEEVVAADLGELRASAERLDTGNGVVISADASDGMNGGAARVRHARDKAGLAAAFDGLAPVSTRLRVMPFIEGVPCSIHAMVAADGVIVFRPVELVMLRPAGSDRFLQAGISSWWDPSAQGRASMRAAARAVGEYLRTAENYRGAFGIDGILTASGFMPNELNPRHSGGLTTLARGITDQIDLLELNAHLLLGERMPADPDELERTLTAAMDANRSGRVYAPTWSLRTSETHSTLVTGRPPDNATTTDDVIGCFRPTDDPHEATGLVEIGPATAGTLVRFKPTSVRTGERLAAWALATYEFADRRFGTAYGPLSAPVDVSG